jgi:glutathione peroxidase-family protein
VDQRNGVVSAEIEGQHVFLNTADFFRLHCSTPLDELDTRVLTVLETKLNRCVCTDKIEELEEIFLRIENNGFEPLYFARMIPHTLKKLAHKKYRKQFEQWLTKTKSLQQTAPALYEKIENKIDALETVAEKRFS